LLLLLLLLPMVMVLVVQSTSCVNCRPDIYDQMQFN
jgi:hypothetical protein